MPIAAPRFVVVFVYSRSRQSHTPAAPQVAFATGIDVTN
jgi:hypothetical protein